MKCRCSRCNYEWESRVEHPQVCARCKSYKWDAHIYRAESKPEEHDVEQETRMRLPKRNGV